MFDRQTLTHGIGVGGLFLVGGLLAVVETRFDGGFAFIWISSAILLAHLVNSSRREWPVAILACSIASVMVTGFFGLGWAAVLPLLMANMIETVGAALLLRRVQMRGLPDDSVGVLARFVVAVAGVPSLVGAATAAAALAAIKGASFVDAGLNWYFGHTLGFITFTPLFSLLYSGDVKRRWRSASAKDIREFAGLVALMTLTTVLVFAQSAYPLLFLPLLPIILITFRAGRLGAGVAVMVLAVVAAWLTALGAGPISLIDSDIGDRVRFLQLYLACVVITILPIAVELARRRRLTRALAESEARYRTLADHSTDIIMNLDVDGTILFVSPSIRQLAGHDPAALIGTQCMDLIDPQHRAHVVDAHLRTIRSKQSSQRVEYLGLRQDGGSSWFETQTRAVLDDEGRVTGVVSIIRDIAERKTLEHSLSEAAVRDPLTGVLNRRGFMRELEAAALDEDQSSCVAVFDLDHFKQVNDVYGHGAGDEVLKMFGRLASEAIRMGDAVGRLGGEEFAILLKDATVEQAHSVCERLRAMIAQADCVYDHRTIRVTVSGGVAALQGDVRACLRASDKALYQAKESGRDRLLIAA